MVEDKLTNFMPLSRKVFEHDFWNEKRSFSRFEAWIDLLRSARFENSEKKMLVSNKIIRFNRGQIVASLRFLATRWGWGKHKVDNYLKLLEVEGMIKRGTAEGTVQTIITICKYESYNIISGVKGQSRGQTGDTKGTRAGQTGDKTNIVNKENKEIQEKSITEASSVYPTCISLYNNFIISQTNLSAKIDARAGASMKRIIKYFEGQVKDKSDPLAVPNALEFILTNYDKWDMFHKKQITVSQIESNLINIVNSIKNAGYTTNNKPKSMFATR